MDARNAESRGLDWKRRVKEAAGRLISPDRPGDFNQALMDLGSAICTPRSPACGECPVRRHCLAFRTGRCEDFPPPMDKARPGRGRMVAIAFVRDGKLLMRRRPRGGLWSGLWELPSKELARGENVEDAIEALASPLCPGSKGSRERRSERTHKNGPGDEGNRLLLRVRRPVRVRHQLTHRDLMFTACVCPLSDRATELRSPEAAKRMVARWVDPRQLAALAVSTAHRKILAALASQLGEALTTQREPC